MRVTQCARDLRKAFPKIQGFSSRNLLFMRRFADEFCDASIVKQFASHLPWWQLYLSTVDDQLRHPAGQPNLGAN
jgi:hypothetical protein